MLTRWKKVQAYMNLYIDDTVCCGLDDRKCLHVFEVSIHRMGSKQFGVFLAASCQYLKLILQLKFVGCCDDDLLLVGVTTSVKRNT